MLSEQQTNILSEGALSQLINSHINEGDTSTLSGGAGQQYDGNLTAGNDSFENANLAFWTRKQNEYQANIVKQ